MGTSTRRTIWWWLIAVGLCWGLWQQAVTGATDSGAALLFNVSGPIGPATSDYLVRGLEKAADQKAELAVVRMDTPGGLDTSMREIIQAIIESPVPVATFVAPGGARAASAGTYILYASHIAAMAPGTNLGAATPVQVIGGPPGPGGGDRPEDGPEPDSEDEGGAGPEPSGDAMERKMVNDAVAYIRSLAKLRGRNADWAEEAVRSAASLPADEALKLNVIDVVVRDVPALLAAIDGREVSVKGQKVALSTKNLAVQAVEPDWRTRLLSVITNPNVAYVLMLIGIYGLFFEFANPGFIVPGVVGAIALVLALYALHVLPVNYAGLALILLGIVFMLAEVFVPSFGALGIGGVIAFVIGSIILMDTESEFYTISRPLIFAVALTSAGAFIGVMGMVLKARMRPVVSGRESLVGATGEAVDDFEDRGRIRAQGEIWQAHTQRPVKKGQPVRVTALHGLRVEIEPLEKEE
ncbi:MAG: nodulation protein NfeD [Gammaproteobacteria bacterium]|nr:nodulation protein NfeD [Gammaproteobacteria bacterium]NIR96756.1 nodulation protein NfeD [Gammaproteobacteria bacterium]NIT62458.1 nodulation protein NfeD [Gammaproteobacteria bacterium]NIV19391.1 nodulation protein NfeD [Gammaproteobacteria bacterium]NIX10462.1 nodulation protein NfeD [Gammaproteobacteria bacterium]